MNQLSKNPIFSFLNIGYFQLGFTLPCPQIEGDITVIYGEAPSSETARFYTTADWENLERAAFHAVAGKKSLKFDKSDQVLSQQTADRNNKILVYRNIVD